LLSASLSACRRYHPAGVECRIDQRSTFHAAFTLPHAGSASGAGHFGATYAFACATARGLAAILMMALSMGFRSLVSLLPAIRATRLLASALAGLSPAERASLRWTHMRRGPF